MAQLIIKKYVDYIQNLSNCLGAVNFGPQLGAIPYAMCEVCSELLHLSDRIRFPMLLKHRIVSPHHLVTLSVRRYGIRAGTQVLVNLTKDPWVIRGSAANHHCIAIGFPIHAYGVFGRFDIPVADDLNLY